MSGVAEFVAVVCVDVEGDPVYRHPIPPLSMTVEEVGMICRVWDRSCQVQSGLPHAHKLVTT